MKKTIVKIDGMRCGMCEAHVCDAIRKSFYCKKVKASHVKGEAEIISEVAPDKEQLSKVLSDLGYKVSEISTEEYEKKGLFGMFK